MEACRYRFYPRIPLRRADRSCLVRVRGDGGLYEADQIDRRNLKMQLNNPSSILWCSVCDKIQHEVRYLVASDRINICSECVAWCNQLIEERKMKELFQMPAANDPEH